MLPCVLFVLGIDMYFRYGNYTFADGATEFSSSVTRLYTTRGTVYGLRKRLDLTHTLQANTPALLTTAINQLSDALVPGFDLGLYESSGRPTAHYWRNADAIGGVRVISDGNPVGDGTEYVTSRTVAITFEADFEVRGLNPLMSFSESVTIVGDGGPEEVYIPVLTGKWPKQQVTERSLVTASQSGEIVIWGRKPVWADVPKPLWPSFEVRSQRSFVQSSPQILGGDFGECKATYSYSFQSNEPLIGTVNTK